jgi:hypothetical protein
MTDDNDNISDKSDYSLPPFETEMADGNDSMEHQRIDKIKDPNQIVVPKIGGLGGKIGMVANFDSARTDPGSHKSYRNSA